MPESRGYWLPGDNSQSSCFNRLCLLRHAPCYVVCRFLRASRLLGLPNTLLCAAARRSSGLAGGERHAIGVRRKRPLALWQHLAAAEGHEVLRVPSSGYVHLPRGDSLASERRLGTGVVLREEGEGDEV